MAKTKTKTKTLKWGYCECGCKSSVAEGTMLHIYWDCKDKYYLFKGRDRYDLGIFKSFDEAAARGQELFEAGKA